MNKDKLIICDLDGTLFDTIEINFQAYKKALNEFGYDLERDYYAKYCNGAHFKKYLPKIMGNENEELMILIHNRKKEIYSEFLYAAKKNGHLFSILERMKRDYYLAIVTTASRKNAEELLNHFKVHELFDILLTHEDVKCAKPDPEGFLKAMDYFEISPQNTMIFEDSDDGIQAAQQCSSNVFRIISFNDCENECDT